MKIQVVETKYIFNTQSPVGQVAINNELCEFNLTNGCFIDSENAAEYVDKIEEIEAEIWKQIRDIMGVPDELRQDIWLDALEQPDKDLFIAEYGYPTWFNFISADSAEIVAYLTNIHTAANMPVKELVALAGTQKEFATKFCVSYNTVTNWVKVGMPTHIRFAYAKLLNLI